MIRLFHIIPDRINKVLSAKLPIYGATYSVNDACASAGTSTIDGVRMILLGDADAVLVGGAEAIADKVGIGAFAVLRHALTPYDGDNPKEEACRPFDKEASGFVIGEGAGVIILEERDHALKRGARIYAELVGYGQCSDSIREEDPEDLKAVNELILKYGLLHGRTLGRKRNVSYEPSIMGTRAVIRAALQGACLLPADIDAIYTHGTGTAQGGLVETQAIHREFGDILVPITSTKATHGHMIAGCGAEIVACMMALQENVIPPTLNLDNPVRSDIEYVVGKAKSRPLTRILKLFNGFGGGDDALIFEKYNQAA